MSSGGRRGLGERIAVARKLHRMTQKQLAEAAVISVSLLRKIEQGARPATPAVLSSIARVLNLDDSGVTGNADLTSTRVGAAIPYIRCALDCHDLPDDGPIQPLPDLRTATDTATVLRLAAQYTKLAETLPALIVGLTRAVHSYTGDDQQAAFAFLALAYRAADAICDKFGYADLSARTIDLIRWAATQSDEPALTGVAAYVRAETFFANQHPAAGLRALNSASVPLTGNGSRDSLAVYGSLHMRAGVLAACAGLAEAAQDHLTEAHDVSRHVSDAVYCGTAFGPSSVRIHQVAAAAEMGDSRAVLGWAAGWQPPASLPAERRSHYFIELARAQLWAGQRSDALASLQAARRVAPQHTRHSSRVHKTVETLLRLERHPPDLLLGFARWAGIEVRFTVSSARRSAKHH
jgi:transcriptional regulator with XRE-family HTH domain